jgi:hypothetical protein
VSEVPAGLPLDTAAIAGSFTLALREGKNLLLRKVK